MVRQLTLQLTDENFSKVKLHQRSMEDNNPGKEVSLSQAVNDMLEKKK